MRPTWLTDAEVADLLLSEGWAGVIEGGRFGVRANDGKGPLLYVWDGKRGLFVAAEVSA